MSQENQLVGTVRDSFGKGAARKLRAAGKTPAVVYGHGAEPIHVSVETHPLSLIVRHPNAIINLDVEGKKHLVLVKDVQKDPVRQAIEHIDLIVVTKGEKVEVDVPIHLVGEPFSGTNALQDLNIVLLAVPATSIPESVQVSVEGLEEGTMLHASDIELPAGAVLISDADQLVAHIETPRGNTEDEDAAAAAAEAASAE